MKKIKLEGNNNFSPNQLLPFVLIALLIVWLFGLLYLIFFFLVILSIFIFMNLADVRIMALKRQFNKANKIANCRLVFIKRMIALSYETEKMLFHKKFMSAVQVKKLRDAGVVEIDCKLLHKKIQYHMTEYDVKKKSLLILMLNYIACYYMNFHPVKW